MPPSNDEVLSDSTGSDSSSQSSASDDSKLEPVPEMELRPPRPDEVLLFYTPQSFFSQAVLFALYLREITFTPLKVDMHRGVQFSPEFLILNPRGEVPVLWDGRNGKLLSDLMEILHYLDDNFPDATGIRLIPKEPVASERVERIAQHLRKLKVETLTFGSVFFHDFTCDPKGTYANEASRHQLRKYVKKRKAILRTAAKNNPEHANTLLAKLKGVEKDYHFYDKRGDYEQLIEAFNYELAECEKEVASVVRSMKRNRVLPSNSSEYPGPFVGQAWLVPETLTIADVMLGIILARLKTLGFYRKMISDKPHLRAYLSQLQNIPAFRIATIGDYNKADVDVQSKFSTSTLTNAKVDSGAGEQLAFTSEQSQVGPGEIDPKSEGSQVGGGQVSGTGEGTQTVSAPPAPVPRPSCTSARSRYFPWWALIVPMLTMLVYGTWGYLQGPAPRRVLIGPRSVLSYKIAQLGAGS